MHPRVVADVDDRGQFVPGAGGRPGELAQAEQPLHAEQEPGAANASDEDGDLHNNRH